MVLLGLLPVILIFWVNSVLKAGLVLLWMSIMVSLYIFTSLTVYIIVLVYISGVLVLMLYFSMLLSNTSFKSTVYWGLLLMLPSLIMLFDLPVDQFNLISLLTIPMKSVFLSLLIIFIFILVIVSMIFSMSKTVRFV